MQKVSQLEYIDSGHQVGPVAEEALARLFQSGSLSSETLVWTEDLTEWTSAGQFKELMASKDIPIPSVTRVPTPAGSRVLPPAATLGVAKARPWVRLAARMLDMTIAYETVDILYLISGVHLGWRAIWMMGILIPIGWLFIEPMFLSRYGATPGKMLLRTHIRRRDGNLPTYREALRRSASVWMRGEAFYIPFIVVIANIIAWSTLRSNGETTWDHSGGFRVMHRKIGGWRVLVVTLLFIGCFMLPSAMANDATISSLMDYATALSTR